MKLTSETKHQLVADLKDIEFASDEVEAYCLSRQDESTLICIGGIMSGLNDTWNITFIDSLSNRLFDLIIPSRFLINFNDCTKINVVFSHSTVIFNLESQTTVC